MKTASLIRVGLFAAGLAVAFGGAFLAGASIDPDVGDGGGAAHAGDGHPSGAPDGDAGTPARLVVAGRYAAQPLPAPAATAEAGDGYAVAVARSGRERRFTVSKDGRPVDDVEPYLGARGHLVAVAERDLAFEHVHPKDRATEGREIRFDVALRRPGRYRLFLQFKHDGKVHTAAFTEWVAAAADAHREDGHAH